MKFLLMIETSKPYFSDNELQFAVADTLRETATRLEAFECGVDHPMVVRTPGGICVGECHYLIDPERYTPVEEMHWRTTAQKIRDQIADAEAEPSARLVSLHAQLREAEKHESEEIAERRMGNLEHQADAARGH